LRDAAIAGRRARLYEHVHEKVPSRGKNEESFEAEALCVRAGHEHRGNDGEHHLEMAISALRNMQVFVPAQDVKINTEGEGMGCVRAAEADVVEHDVVEVADERAGKPP
jgi:hypothetical protein